MTAPELRSFHVATVVSDLDVAMGVYGRILDVGNWQTLDFGNGLRIAYGSGSGQTWELVEPTGEGATQFHAFRDERGEGIQHVGFWTPDLRGSVEAALAEGAQLAYGTTDADGNVSFQLIPDAGAGEAVLSEVSELRGAMVDVGLGGWRIEYIGRLGEAFLREWLGDSFDEIVVTPSHW